MPNVVLEQSVSETILPVHTKTKRELPGRFIGHRWIAMLDILGFRRMIQTHPLMDLALDVQRLFAAAEPREATYNSLGADGRVRTRSLTLGHLHFSDTIMLWTPALNPSDPELNTHVLLHICTSVINLIALALANGIPLRCGIADGKCYIDPAKQIAIGQAIVDAYLLEQSQEWLGAALNARNLGDPATFVNLEPWGIIDYPVPMKDHAPTGPLLVLDWTSIARMPEGLTHKLWKVNARQSIESALSEGSEQSAETSAHSKWKNAAEFYQLQMQRRRSDWIAIRPE